MRGGKLHLVIDRGRHAVQRAAEYEGKAQDVVDLIRIVRSSRRHDDILARPDGIFVRDLGIGIRHREDDGVLRHAPDHLFCHDPLHGDTGENIGALHGVGQCPAFRVDGEVALVRVHPLLPAAVDDPFVSHRIRFSLLTPSVM